MVPKCLQILDLGATTFQKLDTSFNSLMSKFSDEHTLIFEV